MFNFDTVKIINKGVSPDVSYNDVDNVLKIHGIEIKGSEMLSASVKYPYEAILGSIEFDSLFLHNNAGIYRFTVDGEVQDGRIAAFNRWDTLQGNSRSVEMYYNGSSTGSDILAFINKVVDGLGGVFADGFLLAKRFDYIDNAISYVITLKTSDGKVVIKSFLIEKLNESTGDWDTVNYITGAFLTQGDKSFNKGSDVRSARKTDVYDNVRLGAIDGNELPVEDDFYVEVIFLVSRPRDFVGTNAIGEKLQSIVNHTFFIELDKYDDEYYDSIFDFTDDNGISAIS